MLNITSAITVAAAPAAKAALPDEKSSFTENAVPAAGMIMFTRIFTVLYGDDFLTFFISIMTASAAATERTAAVYIFGADVANFHSGHTTAQAVAADASASSMNVRTVFVCLAILFFIVCTKIMLFSRRIYCVL